MCLQKCGSRGDGAGRTNEGDRKGLPYMGLGNWTDSCSRGDGAHRLFTGGYRIRPYRG